MCILCIFVQQAGGWRLLLGLRHLEELLLVDLGQAQLALLLVQHQLFAVLFRVFNRLYLEEKIVAYLVQNLLILCKKSIQKVYKNNKKTIINTYLDPQKCWIRIQFGSGPDPQHSMDISS